MELRKLGDRIRRAFAGHAWAREEVAFRERHTALGSSDLDYAKARPAYQYGFEVGIAESNRGRLFDDLEHGLRHDWEAEYASQFGSWESVRGFVQRAYRRGQETVDAVPPPPSGDDAPDDAASETPSDTATEAVE